ncbi:MAG TPA: 30S ribosomal protein S20 [Planctomycetota bacterium]|nr:30S ribosomal protein S20 [Planctomycetota bacterium]
MAHTISALKQWKQSETRRQRNTAVKSALRTQMKKVLAALSAKDAPAAKTALSQAYTLIDQAVSKGVLHRNAASRHKSRLAARVNALAGEKK